MWHWNSLWAPAPGDPPAVDDPVLWHSPWSAEQAIALQARQWEAVLSATAMGILYAVNKLTGAGHAR